MKKKISSLSWKSSLSCLSGQKQVHPKTWDFTFIPVAPWNPGDPGIPTVPYKKKANEIKTYPCKFSRLIVDWFKRFAPDLQPIRSKTINNCTLHARFFPRFEQVASNCQEFWLVSRAVCTCCMRLIGAITLILVFRLSLENLSIEVNLPDRLLCQVYHPHLENPADKKQKKIGSQFVVSGFQR